MKTRFDKPPAKRRHNQDCLSFSDELLRRCLCINPLHKKPNLCSKAFPAYCYPDGITIDSLRFTAITISFIVFLLFFALVSDSSGDLKRPFWCLGRIYWAFFARLLFEPKKRALSLAWRYLASRSECGWLSLLKFSAISSWPGIFFLSACGKHMGGRSITLKWLWEHGAWTMTPKGVWMSKQ